MPEYSFYKASPEVTTEVARAVRQRKELYAERDKVMHNLRSMRLLRYEPEQPLDWLKQFSGELSPKLPIIYRLIQTAVSAAAKGFPRVLVEPRNVNDRAGADSEARSLNLLLQTIHRQSRNKYLYSLYYNLFGDGLGVTKTQEGPWRGFPLPMEDEDVEDYNERVELFKEDHTLPFYTTVVNPLTFYPPMDEYGEGACMEIAHRQVREVFHRMRIFPRNGRLVQIPEGEPYPDREFPPTTPQLMEVQEVWTDRYCAITIPGFGPDTWIFETDENPYTWGWADPTGVMDPANVGMSIAYPLYYLAPHIDTQVGVMMGWSLFALPSPYTTQEPDPRIRPTQETSVMDYEPGKWHHFATGRKPGVLQPPNVGQPVLNFLEFMIGAADRGGLPSAVSGDVTGSRLPALTLQFAYQSGIDRLRPAIESAEDIIGSTLNKCRRIVAKYGEDIAVDGWEFPEEGVKTRGWQRVKANESGKGRTIVVTLDTDNTQDSIAKGIHAQQMWAGGQGLWSERRAMRFSGVHDVDEEQAEKAADLAMALARPMQARKALMEDPTLGPFMQQQQMEQQAAQQAQSGLRRAQPGAANPSRRRGVRPTEGRRGAGRAIPTGAG